MSSRRRIVPLLVPLALLTAACAGSDDDGAGNDVAAPGDTTSDATADPTTSAGSSPGTSAAAAEDADEDGEPAAAATLTLRTTPHSPIAASAVVESDDPVAVEITARSGDHVVEVPRTAAMATRHEIPVVGMRQSLEYTLDVRLVGDDGATTATLSGTFTTGTIEWDLPDFQLAVDEDRAQPGVTIIEFDRWNPPDDAPGGQAVVGLDHEGEIVWFYRNSGTVGAVEPTPDGRFISHYFPVGVRTFDLLGNVLDNFQVAPEPVEGDREVRDADALAAFAEVFSGNEGDPEALPVRADWVDLTSIHHEVWPMPDGNFLALSTTNHELTAEEREATCPGDEIEFAAVSDVIVEFEPDGTVLRTWDLWDVLDISTIPGSAMCSTDRLFESTDFRDWTHANAVIYDEQRDAIIISSRHTDQVIALDHLDDLGPQTSVRWILGAQGTIPLDGDAPHHQHAVELQDDGSILLYDNGNFRPGTEVADPETPAYSRAVLYEVDDTDDDPVQWSATQVWEHRMDDVQGRALYARFLGDADRMDNGNVLITHGGIDMPDEYANVRIVEVAPDGAAGGDIVWDLSFGDSDREFTSYRAERVPSLYFGPDWVS